jgi:hypothetical protein
MTHGFGWIDILLAALGSSKTLRIPTSLCRMAFDHSLVDIRNAIAMQSTLLCSALCFRFYVCDSCPCAVIFIGREKRGWGAKSDLKYFPREERLKSFLPFCFDM